MTSEKWRLWMDWRLVKQSENKNWNGSFKLISKLLLFRYWWDESSRRCIVYLLVSQVYIMLQNGHLVFADCSVEKKRFSHQSFKCLSIILNEVLYRLLSIFQFVDLFRVNVAAIFALIVCALLRFLSFLSHHLVLLLCQWELLFSCHLWIVVVLTQLE